MGRISQHFYINVNRNPDRDGFCARLTRQTSQLVGSGQVRSGQHYSKRSSGYYPAGGSAWDYYPGGYSEEISLDQTMLEDLHNLQAQRTRDRDQRLKIVAVDPRPKCQPLGAQVDCRCEGGMRGCEPDWSCEIFPGVAQA